MTDDQFNVELQKLMTVIKDTTLPDETKEKLEKLTNETKKRRKDLKNSLEQIQDSISTLRVCIKYILFDIEATKRENKCLKSMLEGDENPEQSSV